MLEEMFAGVRAGFVASGIPTRLAKRTMLG